MKTLRLEVEFITSCLSANRGKNEYDEFEKTTDGSLIWRQEWWYAALKKTIDKIKLTGVKPGNIEFNLLVKAPVSLQKRTYNKTMTRTHEAIVTGTVVTFEALVADNVTKDLATDLFTALGTYTGMTPFGHGLGYGKFKVLSIEIN